MAKALARKRRVRAAHRGSVTRIIGQVYENIELRDGPNLPKLKIVTIWEDRRVVEAGQ